MFKASALGDVPNVALGDLLLIHLVNVADELDLYSLPALGCERQVIVADIAFLLQLFERHSAGCNILEEANLPQFLAHQLVLPVPQRLLDKRIGVLNSSGDGIHDEDSILGGFKEPPIASLGNRDGGGHLPAFGNVLNREQDQIRIMSAPLDRAGVEPHDSSPDSREIMLNLIVVNGVVVPYDRFEQHA